MKWCHFAINGLFSIVVRKADEHIDGKDHNANSTDNASVSGLYTRW